MKSLTWKPDEMMLEEKLRIREELTNRLQKMVTPDLDSLCALLENIGALSLMNYENELLVENLPFTDVGEIVQNAIDQLDANELNQATESIARFSAELQVAESEERSRLVDILVKACCTRDRFEFILEGARVLLGTAPQLSLDVETAVLTFDGLVESELWRLLPLGPKRAEKVRWVCPEKRSRLWWWQRGSDLPGAALDNLGTAARLIHLFPEARAELERLVQAEKQLEQMTSPAEHNPEVVSLAEYLAARYKSALPADTARLPIAAADQDAERLLFEGEQISLSMNKDHLLVDYEDADLLSEKGLEQAVTLKASGYLELVAKATVRGRYELPLDAQQLNAKEASLHVILKKGKLVINLPLPEHQ